VEQAAKAYQIAELRYREGISTQTELLDSRIQLEQAQASRARAARDLQVAKVRLALLPALPITTSGGATAVPPSTTPVRPTPVPAYQPPPPATATDFTGATQPGAGVSGQ
jgi:outer membrane protein TolC